MRRGSIVLALCLIPLCLPATEIPGRPEIREIQQALFTLGFYYTGAVDGHYGQRTEAAIRAYQSSLGATPTGIPTAEQRRHALREAAIATRPRVWPMDEAPRNLAFEGVRNGLRTATQNRDARGVATFFATDALLDFGGGAGPDELIRRLNDPVGGEALWTELEAALSMGAVQTARDTFCMPYVWCAERISARLDTDMTAWVTSRIAVLRSAPDMDADVVELLRYDVLEIHGYEGDWARVMSVMGEDAWLHRSMYRTPYDFRILVNLRDGRWQVTAFVAGD